MYQRLCLIIGLFAASCWLSPIRCAAAHALGLSRGEYRASGSGLSVTCVFSERELFPEGRAGAPLARERFEALVDSLRVRSEGRRCRGELERVRRTEADGVALDARFECSNPGPELSVEVGFLSDLAFGHRHAAVIQSDSRRSEALLYREDPRFVVPLSRVEPPASSVSTRGWVSLGFEHILTGYDHLLFLFALVLTAGSLRSLCWVITSFTAGHSLSFALAGVGWVAASPLWVEPAIALSIAYLGVETLLGSSRERRARVTFPFGLVHGFGFAGALGELGVAAPEIPRAVLLFNSGVELGQLALLALALPAVIGLRRTGWFERRFVPASSWGLVLVGSVWFLERARGALFV